MTSTPFDFLDPSQIIIDEGRFEYGRDWTRQFHVDPKGVLFPKSTNEVQQIVAIAHHESIALVPSGGRTGLSGGAVASSGEWVLSMEKMNKILSYSEADSTLLVQGGVITQEVQEKAKQHGKCLPVEFGATGSSHIGGNVATNAGGVHVLKYGSMRNWIAGLKVVTGKGDILELNRGLVKNNTGYDLKNLFIGSEGTLGLITEVEVKLCPLPKEKQVILLGINNLEVILNCFTQARDNMPLLAFEMFTHEALEKVLQAQTQLQPPLDSKCPYYLLLELEMGKGFEEDHLSSALEVFFERGWAIDGTMSTNSEQYKNLWKYRELITESISPYTPYKNDVSVKVSQIPDFFKNVTETLNSRYPNFEVLLYGHIGDGNLHINILKPKELELSEFVSKCEEVNHVLFKQLKELGGSISAEHGVGLLKKPYLEYSRSSEEIHIMKELKKVFDPKGILNPGKII